MRARRMLNRFRVDRRGNFATLTALTAPVALMFAAFAVDEGALYLERRTVQGVADLAAIAAAADPQNATLAVLSVLADNGFSTSMAAGAGSGATGGGGAEGGRRETVEVRIGTYDPDPALLPERRFREGREPANAARVRISRKGTRHFAHAFRDEIWLSAESVASSRAEAAFSVGSRLARLDGGVLNALLSGLTGSSLSLSLMDYEALAQLDVSLLGFLDATRTELSLTAATYDELLSTRLSAGEIASVVATMDGVSTAAGAALRKLGNGGGSRRIALDALLALESAGRLAPGSTLPADPKIGALELISAAAFLSAADGRHQVSANLGAAVEGVLAARVTLAIGEPPQRAPWFSIGPRGTVVRTAQTRLLLEVDVGGPGGLLGSRIRLPLYLELATAEARLDRVSCATGTPESVRVTVAARPGIAALRIADPDSGALADFSRAPAYGPAQLISVPLVKVTGAAHVAIANPNWTALHFSAGEIDGRTVKRVSTTSIAGSLTASLLSNLSLKVDVIGLGIGLPSGITGTVAGVLGAAAGPIDQVLASVLKTLGVTLGEADVRVHGATCGRPVLVQ